MTNKQTATAAVRPFIRNVGVPQIQAMRAEYNAAAAADNISIDEIRCDGADAVRKAMKAIRDNLDAMEKSDYRFTKLFSLAVNTAIWHNSPELIDYFIECAAKVRSAPLAATRAVLADICGVKVRKCKDKKTGLISYRCTCTISTPEGVREMNRRLKEIGIIRFYKKEKSAADPFDALNCGQFELISNMLKRHRKALEKLEPDNEEDNALVVTRKTEVDKVLKMIADAIAAESAA